MSRPPTSRWLAAVGSILNGVENIGLVSCGSSLIQVLPPFLLAAMTPPAYSSWTMSALSGSTAVKKPSPPKTIFCVLSGRILASPLSCRPM